MSRWPGKYVIGLTGNIAVGKSVVRQMLQHLGAYTIDADNLAHQVMQPNAPAYKPVVETFGKMILSEDGRINRAALGKLVFANPQALKKLEAITHPYIRQATDALVKRSKQRVVVIEAIKLLESDLKDNVDAIWVVDASRENQFRRLVQKRKMPQEDAKQRILAQGKADAKRQQAHVVIQNDGNVEETWKQVQKHWNGVRQQIAGGAQPAQASPKAAPTKAAPQQHEIASEEAYQAETTISDSGLTVKRGMPSNAQLIAAFITQMSGEQVSRMDVMMNFGQKSYLVAQPEGQDTVVGLMGWTVENLVTRMDELYVGANAPAAQVVHAIIKAVEEASKELQSEVGFIFLAPDTQQAILGAFKQNGYEPIALKDIKIPAWREAVQETVSGRDMIVLWKQLRKDRVLQPI